MQVFQRTYCFRHGTLEPLVLSHLRYRKTSETTIKIKIVANNRKIANWYLKKDKPCRYNHVGIANAGSNGGRVSGSRVLNKGVKNCEAWRGGVEPV